MYLKDLQEKILKLLYPLIIHLYQSVKSLKTLHDYKSLSDKLFLNPCDIKQHHFLSYS